MHVSGNVKAIQTFNGEQSRKPVGQKITRE